MVREAEWGRGRRKVYHFKTFFQKAVWLQRFTVTEALSSVSYLVQDGDLKVDLEAELN